MASWIRQHDSTRILMYEPASYGPRENSLSLSRTFATDVLCPMYARVDECIKLANIFPDLPLVLSEYSHMMGECCVLVHNAYSLDIIVVLSFCVSL